MTDLRKAAQMALDALQESKPININDPSAFYRSAHAIEALRAALATEEQKSLSQRMKEAGYTKRDTRMECDGCGKKFSRLMLPIHDCEAEQEPSCKTGSQCIGGKCERCAAQEPVIDKTMAIRIATQLGWEPQREWQGLTDDEQMQVAWSCGAMSADWLDFAGAIEAKLREKNSL